MLLAKQLDDALARAVVVSGSLPPDARDLDLLVRAEEERALASWLADQGFLQEGHEWVRFGNCSAESVDLLGLADWGVAAEAIERLFADARPIDGFRNLRRPGPGHALVLVAQRVAGRDGKVTTKEAARLERALADDPEAWDLAIAEAHHWHAGKAVAGLKGAHEARRPMSLSERATALVEARYSTGRTRRRAALRGWLHILTPRRPAAPVLITFSGVDGAGKTSQIDALREALGRLGLTVDEEYVRIEWMTLTGNRALAAVAAPVKAVLRLTSRSTRSAEDVASNERVDLARATRERNDLISRTWALIVALAHTRVQRHAARKRAADVVICDRYTLDAAVYLRYRYAQGRSMAAPIALLRSLSPRALRSYYLAIAPERALARKSEQYGLAELTELVRLYEDEYPRAGARRLDAERDRAELCAEIGSDVWRALRRSS